MFGFALDPWLCVGSQIMFWGEVTVVSAVASLKPSNRPFNEALRHLFQVFPYSQALIGRRMGVSPGRVWKYLNGGPVAVETMAKIADAFGVRPQYFFEYRLHLLVRKVQQQPELLDELNGFLAGRKALGYLSQDGAEGGCRGTERAGRRREKVPKELFGAG